MQEHLDCVIQIVTNISTELRSSEILRSDVAARTLLPVSVVELIFSRNLTRLKYYANWIHGPNSQVHLSECNRFQKLH